MTGVVFITAEETRQLLLNILAAARELSTKAICNMPPSLTEYIHYRRARSRAKLQQVMLLKA